MTTKFMEVDGQPFEFGVCEFSFNQIEIGAEVSVVVRRKNALKLIAKYEHNTQAATCQLNGSIGQAGLYSWKFRSWWLGFREEA